VQAQEFLGFQYAKVVRTAKMLAGTNADNKDASGMGIAMPFTSACPALSRVGNLEDGGKWLCNVKSFATKPCTVLSLGISSIGASTFDFEMSNVFGCRVLGFDYTVSPETLDGFPRISDASSKEYKTLAPQISPRTAEMRLLGFQPRSGGKTEAYPWAIGPTGFKRSKNDVNRVELDWSTVKSNGHEFKPKSIVQVVRETNANDVSLLKMDIESSEYGVLYDTLVSNAREFEGIGMKQISMELHFRSYEKWLMLQLVLQDACYVPVSYETNVIFCQNAEMTFVHASEL
jgi:hypothetical protein